MDTSVALRPEAEPQDGPRPAEYRLGHLDLFESLAIFVPRGVAAESERPVLPFMATVAAGMVGLPRLHD